jgi:hypothetical protein
MYDRSLSDGPRKTTVPERPDRPAYAVSLDPPSLKKHDAGTGPDGERRVRYTIGLAGNVDDRWRRSLRAVQLDDTGFFRYRLEMGSRAVAFTCPEQHAQAELARSLKQLDSFISLVNRTASLAD